MLKVSTTGGDALARKLRALPQLIDAANRRAVQDETLDVTQDMRRGAPRLTGELADSMQAEVSSDGMSGTAAATARHATFVEHGTEDTPAQPYAQPAAERARRRFPGRVRDELSAELDRIAK